MGGSDALGVVLAGGAGLRLAAGAPKALAMLERRTLLERALATLREVCGTVVVAMSPRRPLPAEQWRGCEPAWDADGAEGPLAGVLAGLAGPAWQRALVLGVDFPLARPAALQALLERLPGRQAVFPAPGGRLQPLCAAYARAAYAPLAQAFARGERSITSAVRALDACVLDDAALARLPGGLDNWLNVNTAQDLARAERALRGEGSG